MDLSLEAHIVEIVRVFRYLCDADAYSFLVSDKEVLHTLRVLGAQGGPNLEADRAVFPEILFGLRQSGKSLVHVIYGFVVVLLFEDLLCFFATLLYFIGPRVLQMFQDIINMIGEIIF